MKSNKKVVITGIGPISSLGIGKSEFWNSILKSRTNISTQKCFVDGEEWGSFPVHKVTNFEINKFNIEKKKLNFIRDWKKGDEDEDLLFLLASVQLAIEDSQLKIEEDNNIGLIVTQEHPGIESFYETVLEKTYNLFKNFKEREVSKKEIFEKLYEDCEAKGYDLQTFMYLYFVAKTFNLRGYSLFINNACASGIFAIEEASRQIRLGNAKVMIVVGGDHPTKIFKYLWFKNRGLYAQDGRIKPFSIKGSGIVFGDGATAIVLEDSDYAIRRNANIYGEYVDSGFKFDCWKVMVPDITSNSYECAFRDVLDETGISKDNIDLLNPHGVGLRITDCYEAATIKKIFPNNKKQPLISAFKPLVGHNLGGSAVLESAILLLCLYNNTVPPTLNLEKFDRSLGIELNDRLIKKELNIVAKMSCAFAGFNGVSIFRKFI